MTEHGPEAEEELRPGAEVFSGDGVRVGRLKATLVKEDSLELDAIVVQESRAFSGHLLTPGAMMLVDELVVPAHSIAVASPHRVDLLLTAGQLRRLPPYLSQRRLQPTA